MKFRQSPLFSALLASSLASLLCSQSALATIYYWDTDGSGTPGFGSASGTWGTDAFWGTDTAGSGATANTTITTADDINFGTASAGLTAGTINGPATAQGFLNMTFGSSSGAIVLSGGTLNLDSATGSTITVNNASNSISTVLQGSGGKLIKAGTGTLILAGSNTFTGGITFVGSATNNFLVLKKSDSAGTGPVNLYGGVGSIRLDNTGTGADIVFSNTISQMSGASAAAPLFVNVAGDNKISSNLALNTGGSHTAVQVDGGTLEISGNWNNTGGVSGRNVYLQGTGNGLYSGKLQFANNNTVKAGAGTWTLSGANTYTGSTTISGGTLKIASTGSITHTVAALSLNSGTARLDIASGGSASFSLMSSVNSSQVNIAGNWTGNAAQTSQHNTLAGTYTQTSGTGTLLGLITGNAAGDVSSFYLGGTALLGVGKGQFTSLQIGGRGTSNFAVSGSAALTVSGDANPAANNNNQLIVGNTSTFSAPTTGTRRLIQQGGTVTANGLQLGGGTATVTDGIYYLNGGTLTTSTLTRGSNAASTGTLYFGGGTFKSGTAFSTDSNVATTINSGGASIDTTSGNLVWSGAITAGNTGTVTGFSGLAGGSGYTPGQMALTFSAPVSGTTATGYAVVNQSGTVTDIIITNPGSGYTSAPTISGFSGGTGASATAVITTTAGGLTKTGTGTLTLSGANTYTGATTINGGTLALSGSGAIASSTSLAISAGATFDTSALAGFSLAGAQPLTLTVDGTGSGSAGRIDAAGLNISAAVVTFNVTAPLDDAAYVIATYTSKTGAAFASVTPPTGYTIDYAYNSGTQIALVPGSPSGYATWISGFTVGDATAGGDSDNDGMENVLEYVLNGNPEGSDPSILPSLDVSGANFIFTFTRRYESNDDTTQVFRYGTDLSGWTDVAITGTPGPEVMLGTPTGGSPNLQSVTITIPKDANTSMFGRLKVTQP